jgi:hypothetical protein
MGTAAAIRERASTKLATKEQATRDAALFASRVALGEAAFATAWAEGRVLTLAQAVGLAQKKNLREGRSERSRRRFSKPHLPINDNAVQWYDIAV